MLNIGSLYQQGVLFTVAYVLQPNGQQLEVVTEGPQFQYRKVDTKNTTKESAAMVHGVNNIEIIVRYNPDFRMNGRIKLYEFSNNSAPALIYEITGVVEIGRAEGLRIKAVRIQNLNEQ